MAENQLTVKKRIMLGGLGAMTPVLAQLLAIDFEALAANFSAFLLLGYLVKVAVLFAVGGGWVYFFSDEHDPKKIFQLGIVAPSLLTGFVSASNVEVKKMNAPAPTIEEVTSIFVSPAFAEEHPDNIQQLAPKRTPKSDFFSGILGVTSKTRYLVSVASTPSLEKAKEEEKKFNELGTEYKAKTFKTETGYLVVVGESDSLEGARETKKKIAEGGAVYAVINKLTF